MLPDHSETIEQLSAMEESSPAGMPRIDRPGISNRPAEEIEGMDDKGGSWGDYPLDDLLIRHESRTVHGVMRRIDQSSYIMDPEFQRDFIWPEDKQSKLIESVIMRIPLPVFYMAEDEKGHMVVVDGLQRLSTFQRFIKNELKLKLADRNELNGKRFSDLPPKIQNRVEDCNLIFYIIDSKVPECARLDIFDRVNSGVPLTRQQMRNSLFMGQATRFLKEESRTQVFLNATGGSLNQAKMRDREFVNRFCAFQLLGVKDYRGDMDEFLAKCLRVMNQDDTPLDRLSAEFRRGLANNFRLFEGHAFRKHDKDQERRNVINASLWDVMSTGLSRYEESRVAANSERIRDAVYRLLNIEEFKTAITAGTNNILKVKTRFDLAATALQEAMA